MVCNIRICGNVQGVFFRKSAKIEADKLGIVGWVRNKDDGSVEILAHGAKKFLLKFIDWCKGGSTLAEVERVDVEWLKGGQNFESFEILG